MDNQRAETDRDQIRTLVQQLKDIRARLQALMGGQVDTVTHPESGMPVRMRPGQPDRPRRDAYLELMVEHLHTPVWSTDADLRVTSLSGAILSAMDLERGEIVGRPLSAVEQLADVPDVLAAHRQALQGESATFEITLDARTYRCTVEPLRSREGEILGCMGLALDASARAQKEAILEKGLQRMERRGTKGTSNLSQVYGGLHVTDEDIRQHNEDLMAARSELASQRQRYQELFEFVSDGYIVTDGRGIVEEANQAAAELLSAPADVIVGKPWSRYVEEQDREVIYAAMERAQAGGNEESVELELRIQPRERDDFLASVTVARTLKGSGHPGLQWMLRDISEGRDLLKENRRRRTFLERLMDATPVGIAVVRGRDHRFEMANAYYRAMPGAHRPVLGRTFEEVFPTSQPTQVDFLDEVYRSATAARLREHKGPHVTDEGQTYWNIDVVPLQNLDGAVDRLLLIVRDVSREVRARKETVRLAGRIQRQADQLNAVFEAMTDAVIVYDDQGSPLRVNRAAKEAYGRDPSETDRQTLIDALHIRDLKGEPLTIKSLPSSQALRGERVEGQRYAVCDADGNQLIFMASAAPLWTDDSVSGAVVVWRDVTEREDLMAEISTQRRRAERLAGDLQRERDRLQMIMENTHAQLAYLDEDFNFVHVNTAYAAGSGHSRDELIEKNHFDLFPDPENEAIFRRAVETGEPISFRGKPFVYADQPERGVTYWDWALVPVKNSDSDVEGLVFSLLNVTERERLMRQLEAQQARLHAIIANTPEGIIVADAEARITLANPTAEALYARRVPYGEDYHAQADLCLCYPDGTAYRPRDLPLTRAALDGETHEDLEMSLVRPDGEKRDLLVSTAPIRNRDGEITGAVGVFRDITSRKQIEEAVRQYAERLRVLHELDQAILVAHSAEGIAEAALSRVRQLVTCQRASVELFNMDREELSLLAVDADGETDLRKSRRMPLEWSLSLDTLERGEVHVDPDLSQVPPSPAAEALRAEGVRSFVSVPLQAAGKLMGALNVGMSITGGPGPDQMAAIKEIAQQLAIGIRQAQLLEALQAYAEELEQRVAARTTQLRASEARFRAIFEQSALGIALLDTEGHIIIGNVALQEMLGREGDELVGRRMTDFAHSSDDITADLAAYRDLAEGRRNQHRVETRYVGSEDEMRWARIVLSLVRDSQDQPQFIIAIIEDITERKRAHQALVQSEKLATTGRLAASLAHEINNPLQTVIGCLGLAEESMEEGGDEVETYVTMAHDELKRAARIVSRLRDLSRPTDGGQREPADVNQIVRSVLKVSRKDLKNNRIRVVRSLAEDLPHPEVVPDRIKQVLLNLVLNARDAMPNGGELTVRTVYDRREGEVLVAIADEGAGIPDEVIDRLFDPFFSTKEEGTGLGLFVSRSIIQEQGGRIDVESTVGEGATFTVALPASARRAD